MPLAVDLDGTLIQSDAFVESIISILKKNPFTIFLFPVWLSRGKAYLKQRIALGSDLDPALLPYNQAFLSYLQAEHASGRELILATATDARVAQKVADHLKIFSKVFASDGRINLKGKEKAKRLSAAYGPKGFSYAGNAGVDMDVWIESGGAILVDAPSRYQKELNGVERTFSSGRKSTLASFFKAIRFHQGLKNIFIFVPLLTAHKLTDWAVLKNALVAFASFALVSSSVYLLNDLIDLESDRRHAHKKNRPFAAGTLNILIAIWVIPVFLIGGFAVGAKLSMSFMAVLAVYYLLTLGYSFYFRSLLLLDVLVLASLYVIRIVAGHVATGIEYSPWLLGFSMFFFLSLALLKRFSELKNSQVSEIEKIHGRGYSGGDLGPVGVMGIVSAYTSIVVFSLYIDSQKASLQYSHPLYLWLMCPLLIYWLSRLWLIAHRGKMLEDAIVFSLKDKMSWIVGALAVFVIHIAT